jgi:hypothetical protein
VERTIEPQTHVQAGPDLAIHRSQGPSGVAFSTGQILFGLLKEGAVEMEKSQSTSPLDTPINWPPASLRYSSRFCAVVCHHFAHHFGLVPSEIQ